MKEEKGNRPKLSDNLEEAVEKHINEALFKWSYDDEDGIEQYVHDAFIAGAKWQKEQMMKEAEVDLEKEINKEISKWTCYEEIGFGARYDAKPFDGRDIEKIARHFYGLGLNAKEENK